MDHPQQPHDCNIHLLRDDTLGSGSYGVVCKAMWGQHLCAAKLLHPIFFESNDPGIVTTRRRFEQECHFLNEMKHPHIVEYLGTSHDPDSGLLVLLMELMDESLTHFLERSQQPLAYHIEVELCHDIAQALVYIHSKEIIHRDLSGNNVLLLSGRAKITDFGMSKLLDAKWRYTPLTMCPGNSAYMPPEAIREPPVYSKKIDCFSFGVLQIQIMTRLFPDPGPAMRVVEDSRSPTGTINMPVLDSKRRKSHIDLIEPTHTLLPTALDCLSYLEKDRPSAQDLCRQLAAVKKAPRYIQQKALQQELQTKDQQLQDNQRHLHTLQQGLQTKDQQLQDSQRLMQTLQQKLQTKDQQLQDSQRLVHTLQQELQTKEQQLQDSQMQVQIVTHQLFDTGPAMQVAEDSPSSTGTTNMPVLDSERRESLIDSIHSLLPTALSSLSSLEKDRPLAEDFYQQLAAVKETPSYQLQTLQQDLQTKDQQLQDSQTLTHTLQQELQDSHRQNEHLTYQVEEKQHTITTLLRELNQQLQTMKQPKAPSQKPVIQQNIMQGMRWHKESKAPEQMYRGSAASDSSKAYFNGAGSTTVYSYDSDTREWNGLPDTPYTYFTLVVVHHVLTMVGGKLGPGEATDSLLSLMGEGRNKKWLPHFPAMPTKRYFTAVVCSGCSLIVAGGSDGRYTLAAVEVLDTDTQQWSIASSLTHPFYLATLSICGERLYMLGGWDQTDCKTRCVLSCIVPELLQSCQPQPLAGKLRTAPASQSTIWSYVTDVPYYYSSCATLRGQLVAVGGYIAGKNVTTITGYNETTDSWEDVGDMPTARRWALVAILNGKMMVVGGRVRGWVRGLVEGLVGGLWGTDVVETWY